MKNRVALLLLVVCAGAAAATESTTPAPEEPVKKAIEGAVQHKQRCIVSHQMEIAGNAPPNPADVHSNPDYLEFRNGDCPSADKRKASVIPAGR